ncbi:MAG: hypothetical protein F6J89_00770 [Symploca sp. SIO1C4]|uniref:Uncharacterized protein n=1 Tax=Symploca sp. SIO1C4 TaxID=2607765 RepID=A0A6B3N603_9CYAN|nr:hypothetical protein [Symploca sp. SIO1C4]
MISKINILLFARKITNFKRSKNIPLKPSLTSYNFEVNVTSGALVGKLYQGSFSFDNFCLTRQGLEWLTVDNSLFVEFTFEDEVYTERFWQMPWNYPYVIFQNGVLIGLQWFNPLFVIDSNEFKNWEAKGLSKLDHFPENQGIISYSKLKTV